MKVGVKPSDLAYHVFDSSHPLSFYKEESLADKVKFSKYSREAFLKDIETHSNLKPVSDSDSATLTPAPPSPYLEPLTPAQKAYWIHKDLNEISDSYSDTTEKLWTNAFEVFSEHWQVKYPSEDKNPSRRVSLLEYAFARLCVALFVRKGYYNSCAEVDLKSTDLILEAYNSGKFFRKGQS
ncbi:hypothetical protein OCU04_009092 [Sclerotinia nivalis]|uniref:Uncharacterized protein n=1 Tax=Sclerotinia nivalis TaxID=352851 RepID=A0A9X0DI66_9HELO|nr:hypothetical protein OCU04_009092 [Sclerotinia nivalis]